jgi:cytochrome P450
MFKVSQESGKVVLFRKLNQVKENDYLQQILDCSEAAIASGEKMNLRKENEEYLKNSSEFKVEKKLSLTELKMSISLFILAGYETTSTTLGIVFRNLALMSDEQQKIADEIFEHFPDDSIVI